MLVFFDKTRIRLIRKIRTPQKFSSRQHILPHHLASIPDGQPTVNRRSRLTSVQEHYNIYVMQAAERYCLLILCPLRRNRIPTTALSNQVSLIAFEYRSNNGSLEPPLSNLLFAKIFVLHLQMSEIFLILLRSNDYFYELFAYFKKFS